MGGGGVVEIERAKEHVEKRDRERQGNKKGGENGKRGILKSVRLKG
jgi:hypothetical protein